MPHDASGALQYGLTQIRPARLVLVQFMAGAFVVAATNTDVNGDYSLSVPVDRTGFIRATASSTKIGTPGWDFRVVDNVNGNTPYVLDGASLTSGSANSVRDLHAPSGWTGSSYGAQRAAAPFAILDTIHTAASYVVAAEPTIVLPSLNIHWSVNNVTSVDAQGNRNAVTGEIESSFYARGGTLDGIYLLGEEDVDTDEYDGHVIIHEFGHYLEHRLGRSESPGGRHGYGDRLDPRVAFAEGWPTAFAGFALGDPIYRDAGGAQQQAVTSFINIERPPLFLPNVSPGWFSEQSVWELVYDLLDSNVDGNDTLAYSFADIWTVLRNTMPTSAALPTIFPFWSGIKAAHPGDLVQLDQLTTAQFISPIIDHYGTNESNSANSTHVLPVYREITPNGATLNNVCSVDDFTSGTGAGNKLGSRRFLRFSSLISGTATITVTATSIPPGKSADPDFIAHRGRLVAIAPTGQLIGTGPPSTDCLAVATGSGTPSACVETGTINVVPDEYILEIYEWTNTNDTTDEFPPIGDTCFDVRVTQP